MGRRPLLAPLQHPNIAFALVMELVDGPTLDERISQGALPVEEALGIAREIADALDHRDLKPANN